MERFMVEDAAPTASVAPRVLSRCGSMLARYEIQGRMLPSLKHSILRKLLHSYAEVGRFEHQHLISSEWRSEFGGESVSDIAFDKKGVYVASIGTTGYLYVHDYESLYSSAVSSHYSGHLQPVASYPVFSKLEAVKWNPVNQDEVACVSGCINRVFCHDIGNPLPSPSEVLEPNSEYDEVRCFYDLGFKKQHVFACGQGGRGVYFWDRRKGHLSLTVLNSPSYAGTLISLDVSMDEQVVYAGSESGHILAWDLRGGRQSSAFLSPKQVDHPPMAVVKLQKAMENVPLLQVQTRIPICSVTSVSINPACGSQLAFGLSPGWSGVMDLASLEITHLHCPPRPWDHTEGENPVTWRSLRTRLTWLTNHSVVAVPTSSLDSQVHFLDFSARPTSRHYVHHQSDEEDVHSDRSPVVLKFSEPVFSLAANPSNDHLMAGTRGFMMLLAQQTQRANDDSCKA